MRLGKHETQNLNEGGGGGENDGSKSVEREKSEVSLEHSTFT